MMSREQLYESAIKRINNGEVPSNVCKELNISYGAFKDHLRKVARIEIDKTSYGEKSLYLHLPYLVANALRRNGIKNTDELRQIAIENQYYFIEFRGIGIESYSLIMRFLNEEENTNA